MNGVIKIRLFEIVICVLGEFVLDWIRKLWKVFDEDLFVFFFYVVVYCLLFEEVFFLVIERLKIVLKSEFLIIFFICLYFF